MRKLNWIDKFIIEMGYIKIEKISFAIQRACDSVKEKILEDQKKKFSDLANEYSENEKLLTIEHVAEVARINRKVVDLEKKLLQAQKSYQMVKSDAGRVKSISIDLANSIEKYFYKSGEIYQEFQRMRNETDDIVRSLANKEIEIKKLLGLYL